MNGPTNAQACEASWRATRIRQWKSRPAEGWESPSAPGAETVSRLASRVSCRQVEFQSAWSLPELVETLARAGSALHGGAGAELQGKARHVCWVLIFILAGVLRLLLLLLWADQRTPRGDVTTPQVMRAYQW